MMAADPKTATPEELCASNLDDCVRLTAQITTLLAQLRVATTDADKKRLSSRIKRHSREAQIRISAYQINSRLGMRPDEEEPGPEFKE